LDSIALAKRLEKHELLEFRRIAAQLYIRNKRNYQHSIDLLLEDKLYKDAIETAKVSGDSKVTENLLRYFVETGNKEAFAAMLFTYYPATRNELIVSCADLVKPDVVLELGWRANLMDFAMPFMINIISDQTRKVV
jgi:clathrin heavy chain